KTKTAIEDGMDHFTLSASKNTKEWSTDVGGYGNLANEFMQTPECHAAVIHGLASGERERSRIDFPPQGKRDPT
ncbi:Uncharacterized protein APZ42_006632, partial [Daphnia magna]